MTKTAKAAPLPADAERQLSSFIAKFEPRHSDASERWGPAHHSIGFKKAAAAPEVTDGFTRCDG